MIKAQLTLKRYFKVFLGMLIFVTLSCSPKGTDKQDILFFYLETCPSCDDYKKAEELSGLVGKGASYNVANPENGKILRKVLEEKNLPDISRSLPILIMGEEYINGYEPIEEKLNQLGRQ